MQLQIGNLLIKGEIVLDKIKKIIETTNNIDIEAPDLKISEGFSGLKMLHVLKEFPKLFKKEDNVCYLEIGVFKGLTLLSVANANTEIPCYGIDNFSFFNKDGSNLQTVLNRQKELGLKNLHVIDMDYEDALENLAPKINNLKIGVFFIDGPHDYRSQLMCLALAKPFLHENALIIIDDSNYQHVRQANRDFLILQPDYKLIFEAYTKEHPLTMNKEDELIARNGWWNGINIIIKDSQNLIKPMYPPTKRDRLFFINDHITHSKALTEFAPLALTILDKLSKFKLISGFILLLKNIRKISTQRSYYKLSDANTYSDSLTKYNFNESNTTK